MVIVIPISIYLVGRIVRFYNTELCCVKVETKERKIKYNIRKAPKKRNNNKEI